MIFHDKFLRIKGQVCLCINLQDKKLQFLWMMNLV